MLNRSFRQQGWVHAQVTRYAALHQGKLATATVTAIVVSTVSVTEANTIPAANPAADQTLGPRLHEAGLSV